MPPRTRARTIFPEVEASSPIKGASSTPDEVDLSHVDHSFGGLYDDPPVCQDSEGGGSPSCVPLSEAMAAAENVIILYPPLDEQGILLLTIRSWVLGLALHLDLDSLLPWQVEGQAPSHPCAGG
jgi:hypothetical protein